MSKIDRIIRKSLEDTPSLNKNINNELAEKFAQTNYQQDNSPEDVAVLTVEKYQRPKLIRRFGAFAAALAVVAGLGGSVLAMKGLREVPESQMTDENAEISEEPTDEPTEEEAAEEEFYEADDEDNVFDEYNIPEFEYASTEGYPENSYDMTTQDGIVAKMLNSVDFYDKASGSFTQKYCTGDIYNMATLYSFQYDVTNGLEHIVNDTVICTNTYYDILEGALPEGYKAGKAVDTSCESFCDGENIFTIDICNEPGTYAEYRGFDRWIGFSKHGRDEGEVNLAQIRESWDSDSYEELLLSSYQLFKDIKIRREGIGMCYNYLNPYMRILKNLMDFDTWTFEPTEYLGREAVCLEGTIPEVDVEYWESHSGESFKMIVDTETGMMLYYVEYRNGEIFDFMVMNEICFDDEVGEIPMVDINDYRKYTEAYHSDKGYSLNSNGMTYGRIGSRSIMPSNTDSLPDLIDFGEIGYIKKEEVFEKIGDFEKTKNLRQDFNKEDGDVLIYSINLYDTEGEMVVGCINYYGTEAIKHTLLGE